MDSKTTSEIREKIVGGRFALPSRTFILQAISFLGMFFLTVLLSPATFGIFYVVTAVISLLSYFSDIGLAAALIQKKENPTQKELATVFTIQQLLVMSIILIIFLITDLIKNFYKLDTQGIFLLHALLISFLLSSLKTIPSVLLERK